MEKVWYEDYRVILKKEDILNIVPNKNYSYEKNVNIITRDLLYLSVILTLVTRKYKYLIYGLLLLLLIFIISRNKIEKYRNVEGYSNLNKSKLNISEIKKIKKLGNKKRLNENNTMPSENNPLMNVLINEYQDNPERGSAGDISDREIEKEINKKTQNQILNNFELNDSNKTEIINQKLFKDLGENFSFENSMRQFVANPNTTIPSDQDGFLDFCYGKMQSCKSGDVEACEKWNVRKLLN